MKEDTNTRKLKLLFKYIVVVITLLVITICLNITYDKEYHWYFLGFQFVLTILTGIVYNKLLNKIK